MSFNLGKYQVIRQIAKGGFATVYHAVHDGKDYALKVLYAHEQADFMEHYLHEITINARLKHPRILPIIDYWYEDFAAYLVMPYLSGGNLHERLSLRGEFGLMETAHLLRQIAEPLYYIHKHNFIHQDIKPENILFDADNKVYLLDFGIAKDLNQAESTIISRKRCFLGSPRYVSPEQLRRETVSHRSDIYSLGLLVYEVLTGVPPYCSHDLKELYQEQLYHPLPSLQLRNPCLPFELNMPVRYASHKDPNERYTSVFDFARDFLEISLKYA